MLLFGTAARAQEEPGVALARVQSAIERGDVDGIVSQASEQIEVAVFGSSRLYSKTQARYILTDFFGNYPPRGFRFEDPSTTSRGLFVEGTYRHAGDTTPLRIYVQLRRVGSKWLLRELLIEQPVRQESDPR
jgi:hypothetical protein